MRKLIVTLILIATISITKAQEFRCQISVMSQQIQGTNKQVFESMQKSIYEFMNNRKWTNHVFNNDEKIECNIMINLSQQVGSERFVGTLQIQYSRPIFNTTYKSPVLNYKEKENDFQFEYIDGQSLEFNENSYQSSLTATLAFYAYIILGLDYDSFSMEGGSEYLQKAQNVVNLAQNSGMPGWKAYEGLKNRYWLIENLTNETYNPLRRCLYLYHRLGLDVMSDKTDIGRAQVAESLKLLQKVYRAKPNSMIMNLFFSAKSDELASIFSESYPDEKVQVLNILKEIDPANSAKYDKIGK